MPCSASAPLRARVAAAAVVVAMAAGAAASPLRALPKRVVVPRDGNVSVNLEAEVPIPRGGEISWPLMVPAGVGTVQRVEVILRNLAHDNVSALEASLSHADQEAVLFRGGDGGLPRGYAAGDPARLLTAQRAGEGFAAPSPFRGAGHDFRFTDPDWSAINAALGRPARQSSTQFEGVASRAVDGDVDGRYESESVTHTGGHGASDSHPWWQVDLGNQTAVAAIKVWSRVQAPTVDTVQVVAVVADGPLRSGSFRLNASYNAIAGATAPIGVNASAEEVKQALEALPHLGTVQVGREAVPRPGAPRRSAWTITFVSEPGRVEPMAALDVNIPAVGARVDVRVARNGSDNVWYNYRGEVFRISGSLTPAWVMLLPSDPGNSTLADAMALAVWRAPLCTAQREYTLVLPANTTGRVVRVQSRNDDYLSLAEVQVLTRPAAGLSQYKGGSPVRGGRYDSAEALDLRMRGTAGAGTWVLHLRDTRRVEGAPMLPIFAATGGHGLSVAGPDEEDRAGSLSDWVLLLHTTDNETLTFHVDMTAHVTALPIRGNLTTTPDSLARSSPHLPDASVEGVTVSVQPGLERYEGPCYGGCRPEVGDIGVGLSTNPHGDGAAFNRIVGARSVVFKPPRAFLGDDHFMYTVSIPPLTSAPARVDVAVRQCRLGWCGDELV